MSTGDFEFESEYYNGGGERVAASKPTGRANPEPTIEARAAALQAELAALRQLAGVVGTIRALKRQFPALFEGFKQEIRAAVDEPPPGPDAEPPPPPPAPEQVAPGEESGVGRLIAYFRARNNAPASLKEIAEAVGLREQSLKTIIYSRHRDKFVVTPTRGRNNRAYFCLADNWA